MHQTGRARYRMHEGAYSNDLVSCRDPYCRSMCGLVSWTTPEVSWTGGRMTELSTRNLQLRLRAKMLCFLATAAFGARRWLSSPSFL